MPDNTNLNRAKARRDDEFYTLPGDVERINALILEADPYTFAGRTVMCPCDDPDRSEWTRYYEANLGRLGLLHVISTCHRPGGRGRVRITGPAGVERDGLLDGDGDFASAEVTDLARQADIIATNPPFNLMRDFASWAMPGHRVVMIMPVTVLQYNAILPYVAQGRLHVTGRARRFTRPDGGVAHIGNAEYVTDLHSATLMGPLPLPAAADVRDRLRRLDTGELEAPSYRLIPGDVTEPVACPVSVMEHIDQSVFEVLGRRDAPRIDGRNLFERIVIRRRRLSAVPVPPKATVWNRSGSHAVTAAGPDWTPSQNLYNIRSVNVDKTLM